MRSSPARPDGRGTSRRHLLKGLGAVMAAAAVSPARLLAAAREPRAVSFVHTRTHERLSVTYSAGGSYDEDSLAALNWLLRDDLTGDQYPMDPALFDILHDLRSATGAASPFQIISGYRSPRTNAMLRERSHGVAAGSLHLQGRAIDIRLGDVASATLRDAAIRLRRGGVGYYAASNFVHVDTGRVRYW